MAERMTRRAAALALVCVLAGSFAPAFAQGARPASPAQTPAGVTALAGAWEMSGQSGQRKCRLTLRATDALGGHALGFPATCARALPILSRVRAWSVSDDGFIRFNDSRGQPILAFEDDAPAMKLKARAGTEEFQLDSLGRPRRFVARPATPAPAPPRVAFNPANSPPRESIPGLYGMFRFGGQEVCRIMLGSSPGAAEGRFLTNYPARCRDQGLSVFDVVAWRYAGGRLFLIARRGHEMTMLPTGPGVWSKDPPGGAELTIRRLGD